MHVLYIYIRSRCIHTNPPFLYFHHRGYLCVFTYILRYHRHPERMRRLLLRGIGSSPRALAVGIALQAAGRTSLTQNGDGADEASFPASRDARGKASLAEILGLHTLLEPLTDADVRAADRMRGVLDTLYEGLPELGDTVGDTDQRAIEASGAAEAYGELTVRGGQSVARMLGLGVGDVLYDLGSGANRFIVQACIQHPGIRGVGIELAASRHAVAAAASARDGWPPGASARQADLLRAEIEDATKVYVASLVFPGAFMARLGERLATLPKLETVATLKRFPVCDDGSCALHGFAEDVAAGKYVEVTWGVAWVHLYRRVAPDAR